MTKEERIATAISWYTDLQRIQCANGGHRNVELEEVINAVAENLVALGVNVATLTLS